ncbi:alkene reductase [Streptomyces sp. BH106]|uniref:alkene reductase n=1 Tax=Streptomyces sp. BH106 TaxID=3410409 RepID=UPI003CE81429
MPPATDLLAPTHLGQLPLPNRLVMAPMTRNRAAADGTPTPLMATYYAQRAAAGLTIGEASTPNAVGQTYANTTAIHTAAHIAGWRRVTDAVRERGGRMFLQLQHGGRVGHPDNSGLRPVAPSAVPLPGTVHTPTGHQPAPTPRALTTAEIDATVEDFAAAARHAVAAGFEGVEVHSANGYLLHQFLSPNTNHRTDMYGGPVQNRIRFTVRVVEAVAEAIGPSRTGLRISPGLKVNGIDEAGDTEALYRALIPALTSAVPDFAYLHLVHADPDSPLFRHIRAHWPATLITNPAHPPAPLTTHSVLMAAVRLRGAGADLISLGRPFLTTPDLPDRLRTAAPLNPLRDQYLMYVGGERGYTDYPALSARV